MDSSSNRNIRDLGSTFGPKRKRRRLEVDIDSIVESMRQQGVNDRISELDLVSVSDEIDELDEVEDDLVSQLNLHLVIKTDEFYKFVSFGIGNT